MFFTYSFFSINGMDESNQEIVLTKNMKNLFIFKEYNSDKTNTLAYWQIKLQNYFKEPTRSAYETVVKLFNKNPKLLDQELFYFDERKNNKIKPHEGPFTPLCLAILTKNELLIDWLIEKTQQSIYTPTFLQYLMKQPEIYSDIIEYFENNTNLLNETIYKKNYHDNFFTPLQLAFIDSNTELYKKFVHLGSEKDNFFSPEFLQYLIQKNDTLVNDKIIHYFKNNQELVNAKIYQKNNDQKRHERHSNKKSEPRTKILYTPIRLALLLNNPNIIFRLLNIGATVSNIYDQQMLLKFAIKYNNDFSAPQLKKLLNNRTLMQKKMSLIEKDDTPLEYAYSKMTTISYPIILENNIRCSCQDAMMANSDML